ncbi:MULTISPECIES: hypothetical protein [Bacillus]|uniref:hypothetical protein n=1 Tax=Bacillus TaxID=1386 RepID=UPI0004980ECA|nr:MULTISPECIES: hypothetical protein [Bacillus]MBG9913824.1 hypothetical protein [Bacillus sonorensis]MCY8606969.1 hypothetical protein [Bacillus sonorensis]MCZ0070735.1 hypothetical protein [Bacillus sonorensis]MDR4956486.1 hypothetical protein [Bacillus sonorensis]MEC0426827.1 hypothetical protein [Bacillus sonorensis]
MNTTITIHTTASRNIRRRRMTPVNSVILMIATVSNAKEESVFLMMTMTALHAGERSAENVHEKPIHT